MTARAVFVLVHRYVGLAITAFLLVAGLTGSVLVFQHELDAALNPALFRAQAPSATHRRIDATELRERLQAQLPPGVHVNYVPLDTEPGRAVQFYVDVPEGAPATDDEYFLDPYTGKLRGSRHYGDLGQGLQNLVPFIYQLHHSLALGTVGTYLMGVVALLWTLDCFVGAYLTLPHASAHGTAHPWSWLARWKSAWLLRTGKLFSLIFSWHRASGLWVWGMLLVFAWSGVALSLSEVYTPVMSATFGMRDAAESLPRPARPRSAVQLDWQRARETGARLMAEQAKQHGIEVIAERRMTYDLERGVYRYQVRSSRDISERYPATNVWLDGDTGRLLAFEAPTGAALGTTITTWLIHLHFGTLAAGGLLYRLFVCAMGLAVAVLSATGVWIWFKKRSKRSNPFPSKSMRNSAAALTPVDSTSA